MTEYRWDIRCADVEFERIERGFTGHDNANFARVLLAGYARVVRDIHIETGSLLASAKVEPIESIPERWSGQISVGGASAGVNPVVRYAASEFYGSSLRHGGEPQHSFFKSLGWTKLGYGPFAGPTIDEDMMGPASSFLSRGRNTPHPEWPQR